MQDEEMDDIIRDAANQHHPAYDDQAWSKMENLLDKQLPQKKDKRRYALFFLLFLLLGSGGFFAYVHTHKNDSVQAVTASQHNSSGQSNTTTSIASPNNSTTADNKMAAPATEINSEANPTTSGTSNNNIAVPIASNIKTNTAINLKPEHKQFTHKTRARFKSSIHNADIGNDNTDNETGKQTETTDDIVSDNKPISSSQSIAIANVIVKNDNPIVSSSMDSLHKINDTVAQPIVASAQKPSADKKNGHTFKNNFAITASVGPGLSYVGLEYLGKTTFTYGAGIAYAESKKFTLRTGFYVSSKIYSANPSDYHPPKTFWTYYPDLQKIDANCKVYEIPVNLTYNFKQVKKHNWFAAAGLASYIMKNENYGYYSENTSGQTQYADADVSNQNKNIFSILTFSGGYQYHINSRFSVMAEPYIELPLNGIGFGKINLNSTGLLFTIVVKPFK